MIICIFGINILECFLRNFIREYSIFTFRTGDYSKLSLWIAPFFVVLCIRGFKGELKHITDCSVYILRTDKNVLYHALPYENFAKNFKTLCFPSFYIT